MIITAGHCSSIWSFSVYTYFSKIVILYSVFQAQRMECSTGVPFQAWTVCPLAASGSCTTFEVHRNVNCIRTVPARPTVQWFLIFPAWLPSALLSWHSHESHITPLPENRVEIIYQAYVAAPLLTFLGNWGAANYRYLALFAWEKKSLQFPTILFYLSTYFLTVLTELFCHLTNNRFKSSLI